MKVAGLILVVAALFAPAASAKPPTPGGSSAVSQYVEQIPVDTGSVAPSGGNQGSAKPAPAVATAIARNGGSDAPVLTSIASSSTARTHHTAKHSAKRPAAKPTVAAPAAAQGHDGGHGLAWLIAGLAAVTALGAGVAYARRG